MKIKITIVKIGYLSHLVNFEKIKKWKSDIFDIIQIQNVEYLQDSEMYDEYLDQKFTREGLQKLFSCPKDSDFAVAIIPYRFIDNFYIHRIGKNRVGISLYGISEILETENISLENFIIKQLYQICALSLIVNTANDEAYSIVHRDTRGCLFDMNGNKTDILYNTEKPIICNSCREIFKRKQIAQEFISILDKELKKIRKPVILKIERNIKKYPFVSIIISAFIAVIISYVFDILSSIITILIERCFK